MKSVIVYAHKNAAAMSEISNDSYLFSFFTNTHSLDTIQSVRE